MERKTLRKGKFLDESRKRHEKRSTNGPGSGHDDGEELGDDEGSN